ncbi:MAG TPA: MoaD/ThiS family protein [Allosphingosinicella sp.]|nr:MoaD/ThiS family protein [Allosphingosinicella sp.]
MNIHFFGRLRDGAPADPVPPGIRDTDALRAWLGRGRPELLDESIRIAVNDEIIFRSRPLDRGDEVAFLPPMSGG